MTISLTEKERLLLFLVLGNYASTIDLTKRSLPKDHQAALDSILTEVEELKVKLHERKY